MEGIGSFLRRYLDFTPPEKAVQKAVCRTVNEIFGVVIEESSVSVRNGVAFITSDGSLKSEIIFRKKELLVCIEKHLGRPIQDIR